MHPQGSAQVRPTVEPLGYRGAQVDAAVAVRAPEVVVPVGAVQGLARVVEVLHPEYVLQIIVIARRFAAAFHLLRRQPVVYLPDANVGPVVVTLARCRVY